MNRKSGRMFHLLFTLCAMLVLTYTSAQGTYETNKWRFSNPKPFGFTIIDVEFLDDNNIVGIGSEGGIARSADGGKTWTYGAFTFPSAAGAVTRPSFVDLHAVNSTVAYGVGSLGAMIKTTDGGKTWNLVKTPLFNRGRNINAVWFINKDTGYIGGQHNTRDSLPKLYYTRNGGNTWDSIAAPMGGKSRIGYINNSSLAPVIIDVTAKDKEIYAIQFINDKLGYVSGSGLSTFASHPAVNAATGLPNGLTTTSGSHHASLLWKFDNGALTDYSTSKERLGYTGVPAGATTNTTRYASLNNATQTMRAMHIINDSTVLLMSFNNNIVLRIQTGKNDSTANVAVPGRFEKGKYATLNFPFPPVTPIVSIPRVQTLLISNPYRIVKAPNGKLLAPGNFGLMATSTDNGVNWKMEGSLPQGKNFSGNGTWAMDISPSGKFLTMGTFGVYADSSAGGKWATNYLTTPASASYFEIEFADCNNGIATGGGSITVTTDGGKTWMDKARLDFANLNISINGLAYPSVDKAYFATSAGSLYRSLDKGTTMDPLYSNPNLQLQDVVAVGKDTVLVVASSSFSVAAASRTSNIIRSVNNGVSWQVIGGFPVGSTAPVMSKIFFTSNTIGYVSGSRGAVYKTTNGGTTWTNISPFPALNATMNYTEVFALDNNTVFVTGNGFPRKVVYKSINGGTTWTDITNNLATLPVGNLNAILMHDVNNGYVATPGVMVSTNNGGATWNLEIPPTGNIFETMAFAPKTVPAGTPVSNRRLFVTGVNVSGAPLMEYGDTTLLKISTTETSTPSCANTPNGTITITATGGIAPYGYSLNGGAFQTSNVLTGAAAGNNTVIIKDAACESITKIIVVGALPAPVVNAGPDKLIVAGDETGLFGSSAATPRSIAWTPAIYIMSGALSYTTYVNPPTTTTYKLTVVDDITGCSGSDDALVTVAPYCIAVKNAFTPNGDGQNDKWLVTNGGACTKAIAVKVFNRYGQLVFKNDNYQNNWEGTNDGKPIPDGTYYYVITYNLVSGKTFQTKGDVTILR